MAAKKAAGKGLSKKVAGQPVWAWPVEIVGAYLVYRWYVNRQAANAAAASTAAETPTTVGAGTPITTGSATGTTTAQSPLNWQSWLESALGGFTPSTSYGTGQYYNDLTSFINGNCVSAAGFNSISTAIQSLGPVPGYAATPLSVCPDTTTTTTKTSTTGTGTAAPRQGFGQTTIGGVVYDILGTVGQAGPIYQVGNGSPVFFAPAGQNPTQGSKYEKTPGALILTPTSYSPFVSSAPVK